MAKINEKVVDDAVLIWVVHDTNPHALSPKIKSYVQAQHWFQDLTTIGACEPSARRGRWQRLRRSAAVAWPSRKLRSATLPPRRWASGEFDDRCRLSRRRRANSAASVPRGRFRQLWPACR